MESVAPQDFRGERLERPGTWAVSFLASWCPFCRAFRPKFEGFSTPPGVRLAVADLSEDSNPLWESLGIEVVPTLIVFREGTRVWRRDGQGGVGLGAADLEAMRRALA